MTRALLIAALGLLVAGCGLQPLYGGGASGTVAATMRAVQVGPIDGQSGWLVRNKLQERLGDGAGEPSRYRLEVELDDNIASFGIRGDRAATRERRTLRARYRLVNLAQRGNFLGIVVGR